MSYHVFDFHDNNALLHWQDFCFYIKDRNLCSAVSPIRPWLSGFKIFFYIQLISVKTPFLS